MACRSPNSEVARDGRHQERGRLKGQARGEGWQGGRGGSGGGWRQGPRRGRRRWEVELPREAAAFTAESHLVDTKRQVPQQLACQDWGASCALWTSLLKLIPEK